MLHQSSGTGAPREPSDLERPCQPAHAALVKNLFSGVTRDELRALHDQLGQLKDSLNHGKNTNNTNITKSGAAGA